MKISRKQQEEIDFLIKFFCRKPITDSDIQDYIRSTVHGETNTSDKFSANPLRNAKTSLDRNIKMWREDITRGLLSPGELKEDFNCEYGSKIVDSIVDSVDAGYRRKTLSTGISSVWAFTNFTDAIKKHAK